MDSAISTWGRNEVTSYRLGARTFPFAASSIAHCERMPRDNTRSLSSFRNSFTPKYDMDKPTFQKWASIGLRWGLPKHGFSAILMKRAFIFGYIAFSSEMLINLEQQELEMSEGLEPTPVDWNAAWQAVKATGPDIWFGSCREWVTDGIRILYERRAYATWDRRTVWKVLKNSMMSACRKICRSGAIGMPAAFVAFLRGDFLQHAADATVRAMLIPVRMRHLLLPHVPPLQPDVNRKRRRDLLVLACKHAVLEAVCVITRYGASTLATTALVGGSFLAVHMTGGSFHERNFGNDSDSTWTLAICVGVGSLVGDLAETVARMLAASALGVSSASALSRIDAPPPPDAPGAPGPAYKLE